jgi:serine/threonine-protein kinase
VRLLGALRDWFSGSHPSDHPRRLGRYVILHKIGEGGMGVVYAARDERLGRTVAVKTLSGISDETARKRFWREARAAASVNHPNVCPIYDVWDEDGQLFLAMELLEGRPLSQRMAAESLPLKEAGEMCLALLSAVSALHDHSLIHRDLKPSNVFLTPHGVRLLDFGLALTVDPSLADGLTGDGNLTRTGVIVGTPRYIAPERVLGEAADARSDLFAVGAILFEMLAGRPAFDGRTVVEVLHATLHEQPPALSGSAAVAAADRVIRRALAKGPRDRHPTAQAMAEELQSALQRDSGENAVVADALTRLVVLPLRALRPDPDTDFLAFSLPDAISTSLAGRGSLIVRSSGAVARLAGDTPDLKKIAGEVDVDRVVMGTLVRAGDRLRVAVQLVEAPSGTLIASHTLESPLGDLFELQDDLAGRLTEALSLPLEGRDAHRDVPASPRAYEFFLRANELARRYDQLPAARDLYLRCLEEDPEFAPAWARLGRCHRLIPKFREEPKEDFEPAERALRRALGLNPELSFAHEQYAHLEAELGRATDAVRRLISRARVHPNDAELFAGLVHACRYGGLFEASIAAHREARRLDPNVPTSMPFTLLWMGRRDVMTETAPSAIVEPRLLSLIWDEKFPEARAVLGGFETTQMPRHMQPWVASLKRYLDGRCGTAETPPREATVEGIVGVLGQLSDPEVVFVLGCWMAHLGEPAQAIRYLEQSVGGGFYASDTLARERLFDPLRQEPAFSELLRRAEAGRDAARQAFREAGGETLLGVEV